MAKIAFIGGVLIHLYFCLSVPKKKKHEAISSSSTSDDDTQSFPVPLSRRTKRGRRTSTAYPTVLEREVT